MTKEYPSWVCQDCGSKASDGKQYPQSTWHEGVCDICGKTKPVTEPRDFYYPVFKNFIEHKSFCIDCEFLDKDHQHKCTYRSWAGGKVKDDYDSVNCSSRNQGNECRFFKPKKTIQSENNLTIWEKFKLWWANPSTKEKESKK